MSTEGSPLPPRANHALLTLQLRAALQEAADAEAQASAADQDAAREQLRQRLSPLMEERRQALDAALTQARADADAKVAAARRAAAVMLVQASKRATPPVEVVPPAAIDDRPPAFEVEAPPVEAVPPEAVVVTPPQEPIRAEKIETPIIDVGPSAPFDDADEIWKVSSAQQPPTNAGTNIVLDAEAFAATFARVFAAALEERFPGGTMPMQPWPGYAPPPQAPPKQSFWAHAGHVDVLLLSLAMMIALVVLAAWLA